MGSSLFKNFRLLFFILLSLTFISSGCDIAEQAQTLLDSSNGSVDKDSKDKDKKDPKNKDKELKEDISKKDDPKFDNEVSRSELLANILGNIDITSLLSSMLPTVEKIEDIIQEGDDDDDDDDNISILEPGSISINKVSNDCLKGKCTARLILSLYSVDGVRVPSSIARRSLTSVSLSKSGVSGDLSHLCPRVSNGNVVFNMFLNYDGKLLEASDRTTLVGARVDHKTLMLGLSDTNTGYNFHNLDTIIATIKCPNVKKISIKDFCEDTNLDDSTLRKCWTIEGTDASCPSKNVYTNAQYPVSCRSIAPNEYPSDILVDSEYEKIKNQLGPLSLTVKRIDADSLFKRFNLTATFSLYSIDGVKVSASIKEKSKTQVSFNKNGITGSLSHLCPLDNKKVVLDMSLNLNGRTIMDASNRSTLLGGRVNKNSIMVGVSDRNNIGYNFHNINSVITELRCPDSKKLKIRYLCEDVNLDDSTLRRCWTTAGADSYCPSNNVYTDNEYPATCR